jgi:enterochelin esterase family protein
LDNLIAQGKAKPMIVAMPYGNMMTGTPNPSSAEAADMYQRFSNEMVDDIIPYVESNFRTKPDRDHRAIAGFSRGGGQSLFTAMLNFDRFAWIGSYSAYLTPEVIESRLGSFIEQPDQTKSCTCFGSESVAKTSSSSQLKSSMLS